MSFQWNNGRRSGRRYPTLWIVHRGQIHTFSGGAIPGVVAVLATKYEKNGNWSNTTFDLELAPGAVGCSILARLHQSIWPENTRQAAYERFCRDFCAVSFAAFDAALARDFMQSRQRMVEGESVLASLYGEDEAEFVEITIWSTPRRNPRADLLITAPDGRSWVVANEAPTGTEIPGVAKLTARRHNPGMRGGDDTLAFAIATGVSVQHRHYNKDGWGEVPDWALGRAGDGVEPAADPQPEATSGGWFSDAMGR